MRQVEAIALGELIKALRLSRGRVFNDGGWAVYVDPRGRRQYVAEEESGRPVAYSQIGHFADYCHLGRAQMTRPHSS